MSPITISTSASTSTTSSAAPSMPTSPLSPTFSSHTTPSKHPHDWQTALKDRIMHDLETMLAKTTEAYQLKIASNAAAPLELLYQFQHEFNREVLKLQRQADEDVRFAIAREEWERGWERENGVVSPARRYAGGADPTQALVEERLAMLSFKAQEYDNYEYAETTSTASYARERELSLDARLRIGTTDEALYNAHNTSYPSTAPTSISSAHSSPNPFTERHFPPSSLSTDRNGGKDQRSMSNAEFIEHQALQSHSKASSEAQLRAQKQMEQQDMMRRRAEDILRRKRARKLAAASTTSTNGTSTAAPGSALSPEPISASSSMSSAPSTSSSSSSDAGGKEEDAPADIIHKAENPLSPKDIANLLTYHDQQWTWMLTVPAVGWVDFPWPLLSFSSPRRVEDLTLEAIAEYVFAPLQLAAKERESASGGKDKDKDKDDGAAERRVRERLVEMRRRWDPARFGARYLGRVRDGDERDMVKDGAGVVWRILGDLGGRWEGER